LHSIKHPRKHPKKKIEEEKIEKEEKSIIQQTESPTIDDKPDDVPKYAKLQETKKKLFDEKCLKHLSRILTL
jgi:hypothetical protein